MNTDLTHRILAELRADEGRSALDLRVQLGVEPQRVAGALRTLRRLGAAEIARPREMGLTGFPGATDGSALWFRTHPMTPPVGPRGGAA